MSSVPFWNRTLKTFNPLGLFQQQARNTFVRNMMNYRAHVSGTPNSLWHLWLCFGAGYGVYSEYHKHRYHALYQYH